MFFESAKLRQFRNFETADVDFSPRLNFFLGENGQGKTNLLEALCLISQGESFRYADNTTLLQYQKTEAFISAKVNQNDLSYLLKLKLLKSKKQLFLNDKRISTADIKKIFATVVFSPESLSAIKEGADFRRQLVDDLLTTFDRNNSDLIADYRKALKTRNRIFKDYSEGLRTQSEAQDLIESLNPTFLKLATRLTIARLRALKGITRDFNQAMQYISNSPVDISVEYLVSGKNMIDQPESEVVDAIQRRAQELQLAELSSFTTLVGPHKHDIVFLYGQKDSRFYCSQGQQRAIILSFKMAQIVYHRRVHGVYPVLMLDDVLSELDKSKRDALITFLHEINTQIFVTTTDLQLPQAFSLDQISVHRIHGGEILQSV